MTPTLYQLREADVATERRVMRAAERAGVPVVRLSSGVALVIERPDQLAAIEAAVTAADVAMGAAQYVALHWGDRPDVVRQVALEDVTPHGPLVALGTLETVSYHTSKAADEAVWVHEFGDGHDHARGPLEKPILAVDQRGRLVIVGGSYHVDTRGIVG